MNSPLLNDLQEGLRSLAEAAGTTQAAAQALLSALETYRCDRRKNDPDGTSLGMAAGEAHLLAADAPNPSTPTAENALREQARQLMREAVALNATEGEIIIKRALDTFGVGALREVPDRDLRDLLATLDHLCQTLRQDDAGAS
jgi:hypothetical protein